MSADEAPAAGLAELPQVCDQFDAVADGVDRQFLPRPTVALIGSPPVTSGAETEDSGGTDRAGHGRGRTASARARGYEACLHNEVGTQLSSQDSVIRVLESPQAALCLDTGHLVAAGGDPVAILAGWRDRVSHVHLKDARPPPSGQPFTDAMELWETDVFCPLGAGNGQVDEVLGSLRAAGTQAGSWSSRTCCRAVRSLRAGQARQQREPPVPARPRLVGGPVAEPNRLRRAHYRPGRSRPVPASGRRRAGGRQTFGKFLGGSATNVAVAAARHGRRSAVITRTGADPFGRFVHAALRDLGVDDVVRHRRARAADAGDVLRDLPARPFPALVLPLPESAGSGDRRRELDLAACRDARRVLGHRHRAVPAAEQGRPLRGLAAAGPPPADRARPGLPADVLAIARGGARAGGGRAAAGNVAVGNLDEVLTAVGETRPGTGGRALLDQRVELAVIKQGPAGVLGDDRGRGRHGPADRRSRS